MNLLQTVRNFFTGPDALFQKLLLPEYFSNKRLELSDFEQYVKWLRKTQTQFSAMAYIEKQKGSKISEQWLEGLRKIEEEIDRVRNEGGTSFLPGENEERLSETFK